MTGRPMTEVALGWCYGAQQATHAWLSPRLVEDPIPGLARRMVEIRAPFSLRLRKSPRMVQPVRFSRVEEPGALSEQAYAALVTPIVPDAQRDRQSPAVQLSLNLHLLTDEEASLNLMPPWHWPGFRDWPGSLVCGRFPLKSWPRPLNAVLEWTEDRDWVIRRGDPLALIWVQFDDPAKLPRLVEARATPELKRHIARVDTVGNFGRNVGPMMEEAARRRPARLVVPKLEEH